MAQLIICYATLRNNFISNKKSWSKSLMKNQQTLVLFPQADQTLWWAQLPYHTLLDECSDQLHQRVEPESTIEYVDGLLDS